jgi:hypothetical protein
MEELEELGFIGVLEVMDCESPEYEVLNREFATVLVDNLLDFLSSI